MPWKETDVVTERTRFVLDLEKGLWSMTELCERYGISRPTGYTWWDRYRSGGLEGLRDRSRRPHQSPGRTAESIEELIVETRRKHPTWGARLIVDYLARSHPRSALPAASTAGTILKRHELIQPRKRRRRRQHPGRPIVEVQQVNDLWSADYKGEFKTRDGRYCYPLTISDSESRFFLACKGLRGTHYEGARPVFERAFRRYGLPRQMLSDNGSPFVSTGIGGLSRLSCWWVHLGIQPVRIQPGRPDQNARHERLHQTLKYDAVIPPAANLQAQQRRFDHFLIEYNEQRPHSSLDKKTPSEVYRSSQLPYPKTLPELEYPAHYEIRKVFDNGCFSWRQEHIFLGRALAGERVGFYEAAPLVWSVYFGPLLLARFDEHTSTLHP